MSEQKVTTKPIVQESWYGKAKGLLEDRVNSEKLQQICCPNCKILIEFFPDELYWDSDKDFEFCDLDCPECNRGFQLCAKAEYANYEFFTTQI